MLGLGRVGDRPAKWGSNNSLKFNDKGSHWEGNLLTKTYFARKKKDKYNFVYMTICNYIKE